MPRRPVIWDFPPFRKSKNLDEKSPMLTKLKLQTKFDIHWKFENSPNFTILAFFGEERKLNLERCRSVKIL